MSSTSDSRRARARYADCQDQIEDFKSVLDRRASIARLLTGLSLTAPAVAIAQTPSLGKTASPLAGDVRAFGARGNRRDLDDASFKAAIDAALTHDQYPGSIHIPPGHYRRAQPIKLPNQIALIGEGPSSVLNSQNDSAFQMPILTNRSPDSAIDWRISGVSLFAGSHGVKLDVTAETANLRFDDVTMLMQSTANIEVNRLFQTSKFFGGTLGSAPYGIKVPNPTTNAFNSFGMEWVDHSECSLYLRGAELVLVIGGRFEGGGKSEKAAIDIENGTSITFIGVYFENVHEYLVRLRNVNLISFVNCHFTGTHANAQNTLKPFKWDTDGKLVTFRDCHSTTLMAVPGNVILDGHNINIYAAHAAHELHGPYGKIVVPPRPLAPNGQIALLTALAGDGGTAADAMYHCDLSLTVAEPGDPFATEHWRGTFNIAQQGKRFRVAFPSTATISLGRTSLTLSAGESGSIDARYRTTASPGRPEPQLSWTIDWRLVAGGPATSLLLQVP